MPATRASPYRFAAAGPLAAGPRPAGGGADRAVPVAGFGIAGDTDGVVTVRPVPADEGGGVTGLPDGAERPL